MTSTKLTLALAGAIVATLVAASTATAQKPKPFYGVNPQGIHLLRDADYELMRQARIGTLRLAVNLQNVERGDGGYNLGTIDRVVGGAASQGIRSLLTITHEGAPRTKAARRALTRLARTLAQRYGPRGEFWRNDYARFANGAPPKPVFAWQILNEQNSRSHWVARPNPRVYGRVVKQLSRTIRKVNRRAQIVLGGMFGNPRGKGSLPSWRYLNRLYRVKGIKRAFKTVAIHPYAGNVKGVRVQVVRNRKVMRRNGHRKAGIRVTEIGWSSARGRHPQLKGPKGQARMLRKSFALLRKNRKRWRIQGLNWHSWNDINLRPGGGARICQWCPESGLVTVNRNPKPSYRAYRQASRK